ncbi:MAG: restriction endonuclease subunit R [Cyanobacteriota bacterium]|nr:restriction endonuclease subunit R [Cyanobacteriota bacterium]
MVNTIPSQLSLRDLKQQFNLSRTNDPNFFTEWTQDFPPLSELEQNILDRVKRNYLYLTEERPLVESFVNMVVLSPLLDLAGFYQPPFRIEVEKSLQITLENEQKTLEGRLDFLVVKEQLWVVALESKRSSLSIELAIPQVLVYMMANPNPNYPIFGLITNGEFLLFLKLLQQPIPEYDLSEIFWLRRRANDLYPVVQILKGLGELIQV